MTNKLTRSIPNYVCVNCGRGFTTKSAATRHLMHIESGKGYVATEAQYRAGLLTGTIPLPAPTGIRPAKANQKEQLKIIAYKNYHSGFYWRLGELSAERLSDADRKTQLAMIAIISNSF